MSAAISFFDSFTGNQINPKLLRIHSEEDIRIVVKEGHFCLINCKSKEVVLHIFANGYQHIKKTITLPLKTQLLYIWLFPERTYFFSSAPTILEGYGVEKNSMVRLILKPKKPLLKVKEDVEKNNINIKINSNNHWEMVGRKYLLITKDEKREWIYLLEKIKHNEYLLDNSLQHDYSKNQILYPTYEIQTNEKGCFFMPIGELTEDCDAILIDGENEKMMTLRAGETNGG